MKVEVNLNESNLESLLKCKRQIINYRNKKNNDIFDDFYTSQLDLIDYILDCVINDIDLYLKNKNKNKLCNEVSISRDDIITILADELNRLCFKAYKEDNKLAIELSDTKYLFYNKDIINMKVLCGNGLTITEFAISFVNKAINKIMCEIVPLN